MAGERPPAPSSSPADFRRRHARRRPRRAFIDDLAVEEGTFSGTHDRPLHSPTGEIPPTGHVQATLDVPVIDGVAAAVKMLEALSGYGLATSRVAAFKRPEPKELTGETDVLRAFRVERRGRRAAEDLKVTTTTRGGL